MKQVFLWILVLSLLITPFHSTAGAGYEVCIADSFHALQQSDCHTEQQLGASCSQPCKHCLSCVDCGKSPLDALMFTPIIPSNRLVQLETSSLLPSNPYYELLRPPRG
jgi:hypothetical protein